MKAGLADCFDRARRSPADALFLLLWLMCTVALAIGGDRLDALQGLVVGSVLLVLVAWTRRFAAPPAVPVRPSNSRAGAFVVVLVVTFTGLDALVAHPSGLLKAWDTFHWASRSGSTPSSPCSTIRASTIAYDTC